jgi:hypothetical protein
MFTATTVFLAAVRQRLLPGNELQRRFQSFRQHCVDMLSSANLRNTLVSQLESLLSFLQNALCHNDQDSESFPVREHAEIRLTKAQPTTTLLQALLRVNIPSTWQQSLTFIHTATTLLLHLM